MQISYPQKQKILEFLSSPANWDNRFNIEFFMDEKRKWHSRSHNGINVSVNNDKTEIFVTHEQTGAAIYFKKADGKLIIEDESSRRMSIQSRSIKADESAGLKISPIISSMELGSKNQNMSVVQIDEIGAYAGFHKSGEKTIFFDDLGQKISFEKPVSPVDRTSHPGRFFHVISFNLASAETWGMAPYDLLDAAKLIVSKDLDLEPGLRTINDLDAAQAYKYFEYLLTDEYDQNFKGPWQWRPKVAKTYKDLSSFQKPWHDSTEFSGRFIDTPRQFFVQTKADAFDLATSLDNRERIWSYGCVFKSAASSHTMPIQTVSAKTPPHTLLHMLDKGNTTRDHRGREWTYIIIETKDAPVISDQTRTMIRENLHLTGDDISIINFDNNLCILAMDCHVLGQTKLALDASRQMLSLIKSGRPDVDLMNKLLEQGADLRFVDPDSAHAGRTFANEMKAAGNNALLEALHAAQGVHDLEAAPAGP